MANDAPKICPKWIDDLLDEVAICIDTEKGPSAYDVFGPDGPLGQESPDDPWEIHFYPALSEMSGGPRDGALIHARMELDILTLQECFEEIEDFRWLHRKLHGVPRYPGAVLELRGMYLGHPVWVRIFEVPPDDAIVDAVIEHRTGHVRAKDPTCGPAGESPMR